MDGLLRFLSRLNLLMAFLMLFGLHGLLYFSLGTDNALFVSIVAALVWTVVLALGKWVAITRERAG